ncbi:hypothetical protein BDR04DRAFT_1122972 [Suillus decipiens]|nr:hypothetical protein BDR04DRAFT_1122972 [Suillus decipiens]
MYSQQLNPLHRSDSHEGSCSHKQEKKQRDKEFADIAAQVAVAGTTGPSQPADDQRANYDIENVEGANDNTFGDVEDGVMSIGGDSRLCMIGLRHKHIDKQIAEGQAKFMFRSHTEVLRAWDRAATQMMTFEKHVISVPYKKEEIEFDSLLLNNGVPFTFILYADKTHLKMRDGINLQATFKLSLPCLLYSLDETFGPQRNISYLNRRRCKSFLELYLRDCITGEEVLKAHGLCPIANALWEVNNSNPHEMLSFNPLHVNDIGNWGNYLFRELKVRAKALGREAKVKIDKQFDVFPRWCDLNHFKSIMRISFSDDNKLRDIVKQMLYSAQNVLKHSEDPVGYALMQCIALDVHIEATLTTGEAELRVFRTHLHAYTDIQGKDLTKNWNFPKVHALTHAFPERSGPQLQYSTERETTWTIEASIFTPNKPQGCCQTDRRKCTMLQGQLEDEDTLDDQPFAGHLHIGAPQVPVTLAAVEESNTSNRAFQDF